MVVPAAFEVSMDRLRARRGVKWSRYGPEVLAAWVADMDFDPAPAIVSELTGQLDRGDLGYAMSADQLAPTYADWQRTRHGWELDDAQVDVFTSALHALEFVLWNTTRPGDGIVVFTPIYFPFLDAIERSGRRVVDVPLDPNGWRLDPERLEAAIDDTTRLVLFCTPHNPTGRVFTVDEIDAVADAAERHDLLVVSDEIWGDLVHDGLHRPLATCDERLAGRLVTLGSASKTFNLAGTRCAVAHIDHEPLRAGLAAMPAHLHGAPSTLGVAATLTAWTHCDDWLQGLQATLTERRNHLAGLVADELPGVGWQIPEATYLAWLDFTDTDLGADPAHSLLKQRGVALSPGLPFGSNGAGFARLNFATSSAMLDQIVERISDAIPSHRSPSTEERP